MAGKGEVVLLLCVSLLGSFSAAQDDSTTCGECDTSTCPEVTNCPSGVVSDPCGCCDLCARGLGELCDLAGAGHVYGSCGEYLECKTRTDIQDSTEATCHCGESSEVCGSNGVTYLTLCDLLAQVKDNPALEVAVRGPCLAAPSIRSPPEDKQRPLGSILVLDCEASGHPVPSITWTLNKVDGTSVELPGDDPSFAVQIRGGPEVNMVTGWVQIMKITEDNLGVYSCVAQNSEGVTKASATVSLLKHDSGHHDNAV